MSVLHLLLEGKNVEGVKAAAHRLKVSQYIPGFDPCVEELGRPEVADVGVRYDCNDEISDSPLRFGEEFIILESRLVDGLFLGSDGILCAFSDGGIVDSRLVAMMTNMLSEMGAPDRPALSRPSSRVLMYSGMPSLSL